LETKNIIYVDETGIDRYYYRQHGWSRRGEKIYGKISGKKFARTSIVAGFFENKSLAPMQYFGTANAELFQAWFTKFLIPELPPNAAVVLDNASIHSKSKLYEICKHNNIELLFLPPYSPDLNPIEKFWANMKKFLDNYVYKFKTFYDALSYHFRVA
jgi:transposase